MWFVANRYVVLTPKPSGGSNREVTIWVRRFGFEMFAGNPKLIELKAVDVTGVSNLLGIQKQL